MSTEKELSHLELPLRRGWDAFGVSLKDDSAPRSPISFQAKETREWLEDLINQAQELIDAGVHGQGALTFIAFVAKGHLEAAKEHHRRLLAAMKGEII